MFSVLDSSTVLNEYYHEFTLMTLFYSVHYTEIPVTFKLKTVNNGKQKIKYELYIHVIKKIPAICHY